MNAAVKTERFDAALLGAMMERLHTACLTMAVLSGDGPKGYPSGGSMSRMSWASMQREWWDAGNEASMLSASDIARRLIAPPNFYPTPKQVDDALPALELLKGVRWLPRFVLRLRAHQQWYGQHAYADEPFAFWRGGWRMIGDCAGVSHERARTLHWQCITTAFVASKTVAV